LTADSDHGTATRELFGIPQQRDARGNIVLGSQIAEGADVRDSVVVGSVILDAGTVLRNGVIVGGKHGRITMPEGGSALFCAADRLAFEGPRGIAFRCMGQEVVVEEGGRCTTLLLPEGPEMMVSNESLVDYKGDNYTRAIMGNRLSFEKAGRKLAELDGRELEAQWQAAWSGWL
jgi:hypothetical protein